MTKETEMKLLRLFHEIRYSQITPEDALIGVESILFEEQNACIILREKLAALQKAKRELGL